MLSSGFSMSTRRKATVTISHPELSIAATMAAFEENLPVPTSRREEKSRPAMTSLSAFMLQEPFLVRTLFLATGKGRGKRGEMISGSMVRRSAAADELNNFDLIVV